MYQIPEKFTERTLQFLEEGVYEKIISSFSTKKSPVFRINTLKIDSEGVLGQLEKEGFEYKKISWVDEGFILEKDDQQSKVVKNLVEEGKIYKQNISSMIPAVVLNPQKGEDVLDLCAAPGSKTTQMAAMMKNQGSITAVEAIKQRMYRLKSVVSLLGVENVDIKLTDGRKFKPAGKEFDKILVDAPCSSEGRFRLCDPKSFAFWSPRKIKEMRKKQKGLLLNACRLLKYNGVLVYSTCTFAPEENEEVVDWVLKKMEGQIVAEKVQIPSVPIYSVVRQWKDKTYSSEIDKCLRVLPNEIYDAFFIAKLKRVFR